ncbi:hypothetical protein SLA2020_263970 [Shorea laevis]
MISPHHQHITSAAATRTNGGYKWPSQQQRQQGTSHKAIQELATPRPRPHTATPAKPCSQQHLGHSSKGHALR